MLVNHSVADNDLGKANGMGQLFASVARSAGPALGGVIWSLSLRFDFVFANFIATGLILLVCEYIAFQLPASLDFKKGHALPGASRRQGDLEAAGSDGRDSRGAEAAVVICE
jgi:MFS family permease